jgi:hypothetical protein
MAWGVAPVMVAWMVTWCIRVSVRLGVAPGVDGGGKLRGEHGGPVRAWHPLGEEPGQRAHHVVFPDGHVPAIRVGGGVARQAGAVGAPAEDELPGAGGAGLAAHPAVAGGAVQAGAELVAAAGQTGQFLPRDRPGQAGHGPPRPGRAYVPRPESRTCRR